jgi:Domain of unknown function (DUF4340)
MRGLRSTIALLAVLVGLGAYIYFVSWKQDGNTAASTEKRVFQSVDSGDIQELTIKAEGGDRTTVKKEGERWQIVAPIQAAAAESDVISATSALANLDVVRVVDENPGDLAQYGLSSPRVEVEYKPSGEKPPGKLLLGAKTPTGSNVYAMKNDEKRVFLVAEHQNASLNKSTFDLRDKSVMKIERDKVESVDVSIAGKGFGFAKKGEEWKVSQPIVASADAGTVESLVGRVQGAQMKSIVTEQPAPADLKKFGLERPDVAVTLNMGSARATFAVGGAAGDDAVYARDMSNNMIVTVEKSLADDLKKPLEDYRRREAFEFRAFTANRVEFTRGGQTVAFERVKGEGENAQDTWKRVSPNAGDVDKAKMDSFLAGLADIRATSFTPTTANTGLDKPALTVYAKFEDNKKEERVTFGQSGSDMYFTRPGEPGAAKAEAEKFNDAIKALDELSK